MVRKQDCKCPEEIKKYCKHSKVTKTTECKDFNEIVKALKVEDELHESRRKPSAPPKEPRFKTKPFRPPPSPSDAKLRLGPPMYERVRFATHCPQEPAKAERIKPLKFVPDLQTLKKRHANKSGKAVTYDSGTVGFPEPFTLVKHTESDASILNVPSPKLSGEVIPAQRAAVRPALPPKSGNELYKPRSGVVINAEKGHVSDPGYHLLPPAGMINVCEEPEPLGYHKEGVCNRKTCNKKRCRKFAAMRKQKEAKKRLKRKSRGACSVHGGKRKKGEWKPYADDCLPDDIPKQEHAHIPPNLKRGTLETHSLTVLPCNKEKKSEPVYFGILTGSYNMYDSKFGGRSRGRQALTMSVMAYCLAFHYHPKQWTMKLIDNLVDAGDTWYIQCLDKVHDHSAVQGMCEVLPFGKKQTLTLNGKKMQVLLGDPDVVGYTMSKDPMVYNLCRGLKAFFKENRAGVLLSRVLKVVIWKDRICYYIFDPAGRDSRAYSNFTAGRAALINVATLEHVADVLLARTVLEDQKFVLAYVKVLKMADEAADEDFESDKELTQAEKAMMGFRILDENCAIVNANMHLGDRCFEDARFRQAVPVAVVAMTYAKISPPNTWFTKTLDKILRLGNKLYLDCSYPKVMIDMTIDNIPNEFTIGPYICEIIIYRETVKGQLFTTKECLFNIKSGLEDFFKHEHNSGILEFNNYTLAVWRQKDMYYMFDPYPRANDGQRGFKKGRACCWMLLNPSTIASVFMKNWDYMPATSQFYIHAFKVLKLTKNHPKTALVCTLSDEKLPKRKRSRKVLPAGKGDGKETFHDVMPNESVRSIKDKKKPPDTEELKIDEEQMGDIISLVDSIQDDYIPAIPLKYKNMPPEDPIEKVVSLDSPTVSVTQVVPPWPKPRDKTNELPEPDPDPEPTPPPTPPPPPKRHRCRSSVSLDSPTVSVTQVVPPWPKPRGKTNQLPEPDPDPEPTPPPTPPPPPVPEGAEEEQEEAAEEEEDEETIAAKKEEAARLKAEEEEARRKAEELPPPFPPPPPSPQGEPEELAPLELGDLDTEREVETVQPPVNVERKILLTEDAKTRFKLRQIRKKATPPLDEQDLPLTPSQELAKPSNFITLPDGTGIIRGKSAIVDLPKMADSSADILPFAAIMAIVTSYKYCVNTWTSGLVDFVVSTASKLYMNKKERFQVSPVHIIPKIGIGHQTFSAHIDVATEGPTWQMEEILRKRFLDYIDRGMLTTPSYSCAFFRKNKVYYLFDGSPCNPMGLSNKAYEEDHAGKDKKEKSVGGGKACLMRFQNLHDMVARIMYNKDGIADDQQFIVSKVLVRRLLVDPRMKLPEDYDYDKGMPKSQKSKTTFAGTKHVKKTLKDDQEEALQQPPDPVRNGYQLSDGVFRIEGTTALKDTKAVPLIKACHFVSLIAMLMATMHPLRTWNHQMVDTCTEKGLEIFEKAVNRFSCEKRVIRNIMIGGKFININIKKIMVVNENVKKTLEQYIRAVMKRLRYVIVRYPEGSMVIVQSDNQYHLFDPYPAPAEEPIDKDKKKDKKKDSNKGCPNASWTLYKTQEDLIRRIRKMVPGGSADNPEFYTFELTSVKQAPRQAAINYRLSPMFKPDENPNAPYLHPRKVRPLVNEKMYWLDIDSLPWSRMNGTNDLGFDRKTPRTLWNEWDIEFPGDLYSLFGNIHPKDKRFDESTRGQQYLATSVVGIVMTKIINLKAWTSGLLDGIVEKGNAYHQESIQKIGSDKNHEMTVEDLAGSFDMYPYNFTAKFSNVIFGFVYNIFPDRFNLSKALDYFFEDNTTGLLTSAVKNLAFGKIGYSYFMFDCQTYGCPTFCFGKGAAYIFKCESLNRLVYCMTMAINAKKHGLQFNLYNVDVKVGESSKKPVVAEK